MTRLNALAATAVLICLGVLVPVLAQAQAEGVVAKYSPEEWKSPAGGTLKYRVRKPDQIETGKRYPLVLFLHGAGGRGADNRAQILDAGGGAALDKAGVSSTFGAYVIAGQVPKGKLWVDVSWSSRDHQMPKISDSMRMMLEALDEFAADVENQVDPQRIYVVGLSMGGYGTWDAIQRRPEFFAAAVPICGGGDSAMVQSLD